ncbi:ROK family transcriptional regulator [Phaeovulum vinaykumarii]|uniref:Transcriptional regulator, MarR family n=1 Tax=Phaeovulum vinaykumarii TaxID=407234 RepID=A0A1N7K1B2_9RHOB|nr:ROK family transcriptional regulator [Phaeovulum vinaykumarii]SIS55383.1 transcriptional regulator, MarR family [Phaeovulum vinaykumarii]SOB92351.1 MarR family transcriptional regulator [Phaeovulum vinaykumarii]
MPGAEIRDPTGGANHVGLRDYNERVVMSVIQRHGAIASVEIARRTRLSAQTVSVILRRLEAEGLITRGTPQRGKFGKPQTPVALAPGGVLSLGFKIGRRTTDLVLVDLAGKMRARLAATYAFPTPDKVMGFLRAGLPRIEATLSAEERARIAGIGVAVPFELWNWLDTVRASPHEMEAWRDFDFAAAIGEISDHKVFLSNDATAACAAEHAFGQGRGLSDYAYVFIGYFCGGGVVLNGAVHAGRTGNAGAFGTLPVGDTARPGHQLLHKASLYLLERRLLEAGEDPMRIWRGTEGWEGLGRPVDDWIEATARHLAVAAVAVCSVIDFEAVVIDGGFPTDVRARLIEAARRHLEGIETQGIARPVLREGAVGAQARSIGGAFLPIASEYLMVGASFGT